ncbi:CGNR zinc finger domain-containing protein [Streptomyces sp. NPDC015130]|uniref:CGNR zinc finger domain-containing protein n=1 Tax=Streptomyces sp. NPDC015130 TaxID=3364940 RepID=UPI0036FF6050
MTAEKAPKVRTAENNGSGAPDAGAGVTLMGGHPVLDFANTVAWRTDPARRAERVQGPTAWARWAVAAGLLTPQQSAGLQAALAETGTEETQRRLAELRHLRDLLWPVLDALTEGGPPPAEEWSGLRQEILRARENAALPPAFPLRWQPGTERLADLGHILALQAEELLSGPGLDRIRRCGGPGCGWFFLDRSRSGTRRWCSSGDCGNRDRARRHYARTKNAP